jgi:hypothetical protein
VKETDMVGEEFWAYVTMGGDDECWPFTGPGWRGKYGHVRIAWRQDEGGGGGGREYAHRVAWRLSYGPIESDAGIIRHSCDNGWCCNISHLSAGTALDNVKDREARNRRTPNLPRGSKHWSSKLVESSVVAVRMAREQGYDAPGVAKMFGVSPATIYNVWEGRHHHLDGLALEGATMVTTSRTGGGS